MFVDKRPLLVGVARKTDRILRGGSAYLFRADRPMDVVAITALDQPFVHAMMEWHCKLRFLVEVARVAKLRLSLNQQKLRGLRMVGRMARCATDVVLGVLRIDCIHVLRATGVAGQAAGIDFFGGVFAKDENLGFVATTSHVR